MPVSRQFLRSLSCLLLVCCAANYARSEVTEAQRAKLKQAFDSVREAGESYQAGQLEKAGEQLIVAMRSAGEGLSDADQDTHDKAASIIDRIERAHVMLQLDGIVLPPFERPEFGKPWHDYTADTTAPARLSAMTGSSASKPDTPRTRPDRTRRNNRNTPEPETPANNGVSFVNQVAPILVAKCGRCHIQATRGNFALTTYEVLMKGPAAGVVVFPGDPVGSRLIETIETGDMPRGGDKVSPDQLNTLKQWVKEGAKFDGPTPAAPLASLSGSASPAPAPAQPEPMKVATATGKETVSFAKDIAPLLVDNCTGCHLEAMQIRGGLNMNTLAQLLRGGDSGEAISPGNGDASLIVKKLRGQEGQRMPAGGRPALPEESIQLVSKWIDEGATLDIGADENQTLRVMVTETWAKNASHDELAERRTKLARDNWKLGAAEESRTRFSEYENDDVFVIGTADEEQLKMVGDAASEALQKALTMVPASREKLDSGKAQLRGRVSIVVFPKRYDYGEYAKMVEGRDVPANWNAHWRYNGVDAYISMVVSDNETAAELMPRLVAPMASLAIAMRGDSPRWFREGMGRAIAAKTVARELDGVKQWDAAIPAALTVVKTPKELVDEKLPPAEMDVLGYGLSKVLTDRQYRKQLEGLLRGVESGEPFDEAFAAAYRAPLESFVTTWMSYAASGR